MKMDGDENGRNDEDRENDEERGSTSKGEENMKTSSGGRNNEKMSNEIRSRKMWAEKRRTEYTNERDSKGEEIDRKWTNGEEERTNDEGITKYN